MREIKFRAWDTSVGRMGQVWQIDWNMKQVFYYYDNESDWSATRKAGRYCQELKNVILLQFTGLKDKQGKEICEGDILSFAGNITADDSLGAEPNGFIYDETSKHVVVWDEKEGAWFPDTTNALDNECWKYRRDTRLLMRDGKCEIIGNIYENPELIPK